MTMIAGRPHILISSTPLWSHIRSLCVLAAKIAVQREIDVTFLVTNFFSTPEKVRAEIDRIQQDAEHPSHGNVRVVVIGEEIHDAMGSVSDDPTPFKSAWAALFAEQPIVCSRHNIEYSALPRPSLAILDGCLYAWFKVIRSVQPAPPVFLWCSGFSAGAMRLLGPAKFGGQGDYLRSFENPEVTAGTQREFKGDIVKVPGMPAMYDWEFEAQSFPPFTGTIPPLELCMARFFLEADGIASSCVDAYDGEGLSGLTRWVKEMNKPVFHLGPMVPLKPGTSEFSQASLDAEIAAAAGGMKADRASNRGAEIMAFLNHAQKTYGERSVIYISFGTLFWPRNGDLVQVLLNTLENRGIPFLLSHASPVAQLPETVVAHFKKSELGLLSAWSPQQSVLAHKAVGWFLTHGGYNGTMEALTQGVPMIGWPFVADQPANIINLVENLDVAFELLEARTGENGLKPIFRTGYKPNGTIEAFANELNNVLDDMKGGVGERKRANAKKVQDKLAKAWCYGGVAQTAFDEMLDNYNAHNPQ